MHLIFKFDVSRNHEREVLKRIVNIVGETVQYLDRITNAMFRLVRKGIEIMKKTNVRNVIPILTSYSPRPAPFLSNQPDASPWPTKTSTGELVFRGEVCTNRFKGNMLNSAPWKLGHLRPVHNNMSLVVYGPVSPNHYFLVCVSIFIATTSYFSRKSGSRDHQLRPAVVFVNRILYPRVVKWLTPW